MNIYVAGSSLEVALIEEYMRRLRAAGHIITHDWTVPVRESAQIAQRDYTEGERWHHARVAHLGVLDAGIFWMLIPSPARPSTYLPSLTHPATHLRVCWSRIEIVETSETPAV